MYAANDPKGKRPMHDDGNDDSYIELKSGWGSDSGNDRDVTLDRSRYEQQMGTPIPETTELRYDLSDEEISSMQFQTEKDAEDFYNPFARSSGFSVRKSYRKVDAHGNVRYRAWVCSSQGHRDEKNINREDRQREARPVTRVNCPACFKIRFSVSNNKFVVSEFIRQHSHKLASPASVQFLRSHRRVSDADLAQAKILRKAGMKASQIMKLFVLQCGGYQNVPFLLKDLYNKMNASRLEEIADGDAEGAIAYLAAKKDADPDLYFSFSVHDEGTLSRLFWSDGRSRKDFQCFGDVLVFDSTYKTNRYAYPLVVLCGVNSHFSTTIFACSIIADESEDTYVWVIQTFLEAMGGKQPSSVVTDGAPSMRKAIRKCLPSSKHRLCCWHLARNLNSNVASDEFKVGFKQLMFKNCSTDQFESTWTELVAASRLEDHEWVNKAYRMRERWALAYLRGHFFAGMRSTQRSEKMNDVLKIYLHREMRLFEYVRGWDLAISWLRHEEARFHAETEHTSLLPITELHYLEHHAAEVFTRRIFIKVRAAMKSQGLYYRHSGIDDGVQCVHFVGHTYSDKQWRVQYNRPTGVMHCSCMQLETLGLPCTHMIRIMLIEHLKRIPDNCILKRWTRAARDGIDLVLDPQVQPISINEMARYARLSSDYNTMCFYASKTTTGYFHLLQVIERETAHVQSLSISSSTQPAPFSRPVGMDGRSTRRGVGDPHILANRRVDEKKRAKDKHAHNKCGNCGRRGGHNKRTCKHLTMHETPVDPSFTPRDPDGTEDLSSIDLQFGSASAWLRGGINMPTYGDQSQSSNDWGDIQFQEYIVNHTPNNLHASLHGGPHSFNGDDQDTPRPIQPDDADLELEVDRDIDYPAW